MVRLVTKNGDCDKVNFLRGRKTAATLLKIALQKRVWRVRR